MLALVPVRRHVLEELRELERDERDAAGFVKDVRPLIAKVTYGATVEEKLANAILLASAHDLMEAARDAADCLDAVAGDMPPAKAKATRSIAARIRATITTATGNE